MSRNKQNNRPHTDDGQPFLKMKEPSEATGVTWSTVQYYVQQGLLPKPIKTSRNMAWYPPDFVDRIKKIKELVEKHDFKLSVIKRLMQENDQGFDLNPLLELRKVIFSRKRTKKSNIKEFLTATGLSREQTEDLIKAGLIIPHDQSLFDKDDIDAGKAFELYFRMGLSIEQLKFYVEITTTLVKQQMTMRDELTQAMSYEDDAAATIALLKNGNVIRPYLHDRIFENTVLARQSLKDRTDHP